MSGRPRVLFYVQHLLGIGHLRRAALLVQGWLEAGLTVTVASGGVPLAGLSFGGACYHQLPPLRAADARFSALLDADGRPPDEPFKQRRRQQLLTLLQRSQPDILMLESYPFGRRQLRWELLPLLEAADRLRPRPLICSSVRDILQRRSAAREQETQALVMRYIDRVQVHGDPTFITLPESMPASAAFAERLDYTGYVTDPALERYAPAEPAEVLVSAGGGAVGDALFRCALASRKLSGLAEHPWRLLLGPNLGRAEAEHLAAAAGAGVIVEPVRADFTRLLSRCAVSLSQGGYNTLMDIVGVGCPALVVPFEGQGETEQRLRCERLQHAGALSCLPEASLSPARLAAALDRAWQRPPQALRLQRDGARRSAQLLLEHWQRGR